MKKTLIFTPLFACILLVLGCDTEQSIPAYLYIPDATVRVDSAQHGAPTSKIIDAWVYANDNLVGGFRLPATVPIITDGNTRITVLGGVAENGDFSTPSVYPFYEQFNTTLNLQPKRLDTLRPVFKYYTPTVNAPKFWVADFENDNKFTEKPDLTTADTTMVIGTENGNKYGRIVLEGSKNQTLCGMTSRISPDLSQPVWVEIDYKGTNGVTVGVIGYDAGGVKSTQYVQKAYFVPKSSWNKLYVSLGREMIALKQNNSTINYQIVLYAKRSGNANTEVNVDNVKILYY